MKKGLLGWMLVTTVVFIVSITVIFIAIQDNYYIIDKGHTLSYTDEHGFVHDEIFWFILHEKKDNTTIVLFVRPLVWYAHSVGERYGGNKDNSLPYVDDAELAKYLEEAQ